ncbi:unnamed protein product [Sphagnum compactum]
MCQVPIPIWSLVTLVYSAEYDIITAPMQLFYDTYLTTAEGATAQMEYASHCPDNTRPSFDNMHSNDFALEQNGWQRKPAESHGCNLEVADNPATVGRGSIVLSIQHESMLKALSTFHTSSTAEYLLHEVLTMSLPKHYGDQSRTLTESS